MSDIKAGDIQITGMADLERQLLSLSDKIAKNVMWGAMRAGAVVVQREAKRLCPVSAEAHWLGKKGSKDRRKIQPGELKKKGIRVRRVREGTSQYRITVAAYVSKKYWYGPFVERGHVIARKARTKSQKRDNAGHQGHVAARPFMRPAFDSSRAKMLEAARDYLAERIPKELAHVK